MRLISMQQGGDMKATFELFCRALNEVGFTSMLSLADWLILWGAGAQCLEHLATKVVWLPL